MRSIFLLRWGTGGPLDGQGALARHGPRMRAAFGLPEPPASAIAALARGSRYSLVDQVAAGATWGRSGPAKGRGNRGKIVTRRAEICGPNGSCPRVDPLARDETAGGAPGGRDGRRGKLGEWAGAAGARVEPAPGRACPRATARGHARSGFAGMQYHFRRPDCSAIVLR